MVCLICEFMSVERHRMAKKSMNERFYVSFRKLGLEVFMGDKTSDILKVVFSLCGTLLFEMFACCNLMV